MKAFLQVAKNEINYMFIYRASFVIWRLRAILQLFTLYFLWIAMLPKGSMFHGYNQALMITYTIGTSFITSLVLSSKTDRIGAEINDGTISTHLLKPNSFFLYWLARDAGDKTMNIMFSFIELTIFMLLLRPPFFFQTNFAYLIPFVISLIFGLIIFFFFSLLLGFLGFWTSEIWGPRFIFFQLLSFFAGSLFPLDLLPKGAYEIIKLLPFSYLLFFPLKIYLGQLDFPTILIGLIISGVWVFLMYFIVQFVWNRGLRAYSAQGS